MKKMLIAVVAIVFIASFFAYAEAQETATTPAKGAASPAPQKAAPEAAPAKPAPNPGPQKAAPAPAVTPAPTDSKKCCGWLWLIALIPSGMFVLFLFIMKSSLSKSDWNLGDALSESDPMKDKDGNIIMKDKDGKIVTAGGKPFFAKSASRLIAFVGFFVINFWLIGLSIPTLYYFACNGQIPKLNDVSTFLLAQAGAFAPYIANKLVSTIKS